MRWLDRFAKQGEAAEPDYAQARRWAEAAAAQGVAAFPGGADGQAMLAAVYHLSAGVARDPVRALSWLIRAQNGDGPLANPFLLPCRAVLSPDATAEAKRRAAVPLEAA